MFYVCKKREDGKFGVMDTQDGVVEYYTPQDIIRFVTKLHVDIKGVHHKDNGKFGISVLKPTNFQTVDTEVLDSSSGEIVSSFDPMHYRMKYENLSNKEVTQLALGTFNKLCEVIQGITFKDYSKRSLDMLDGIDCLGFDEIPLKDDYTFSIYFNPDVQPNLIVSNGFGLDVFKNGKMLDDGHFDSSFSDWKNDFLAYKYNYLFSVAYLV